MNIKGFRRMLFGEKMPDKNDPKYKERYERDVVYRHHPVRRTATEMQDSVLRERHKMLSVPHVRRFDTKESGTERPE